MAKKMIQVRYTTENGTLINENIDYGRTKMFERFSAAKKYADEIRSYVFDIYRQKPGQHRKFYCYGVPK